MGFFSRFLDVLFPPKDTERIVRELSEMEFMKLVSPTRMEQGATYLLPYRHRLVRAVILEAKFKRNRKAIRLLGSVLRDYLSALSEETSVLSPQTFMIVPIPLSEKRLRERGYNQVEEVALASGAPIAKILVRTRDTAPQTTLSRSARLTNMTGAFRASLPAEQDTYIVLDDVITTGATLESAGGALKSAGAQVVMVALSH